MPPSEITPTSAVPPPTSTSIEQAAPATTGAPARGAAATHARKEMHSPAPAASDSCCLSRRWSLTSAQTAAPLAAGRPVAEATGSMVDIGGGTTEVGVISLGGMVYK